ncbi:MAG: F0F1 ATP synthase subunit B [Muribaculaceae bacterium]|jgi:F-type H+-transporting ATPase subunit b|nr:F0F1 ATP synthase subunit B [Muribaculaceae bacterium]
MELFKPEIGLVFWMFIVFLLLLFVLGKYGWPAIIKSLDKRAALIDKGVEYAQNAKEQLDSAKAEAEKIIAEGQRRQDDILRDAEKMRTSIIEEAKAAASVEAKKVIDAAQLSIEQSRKESELQFRNEVSAFAINIAEKMVRKDMANDKAQADLVDKLLNEVEKKN